MFDFIKDNPITFIVILIAIASPSLFFGAVQVFACIILGIILLMLILGIVFRAKIRKMQRSIEEQMRNGQSQGQAQGGFYQGSARQRTRHEGDVEILSGAESGEKKVSNDVGDYVDFEEIKK